MSEAQTIAYQRGQRDFGDGVPANECPYWSELRYSWLNGWNDASLVCAGAPLVQMGLGMEI